MKFKIEITNLSGVLIDLDDLVALAHLVWETEKGADGQVRIIITDDGQLRDLNKRFKKHDYETDVLSFRLSDESDSLFEGEIYISIERVIENAVLFRVSKEDELRRIVAHGLLHFLGHQDNCVRSKSEMTRREDFYLNKNIMDIPG